MLERAFALLRLDKLTWIDALDIALVAFLIYFVFDAVRGTRAAQMLLGIVLFLGAYEATGMAGLRTLNKTLAYAIQYVPFIVIVVFQSEIRRALTALGKTPLVRFFYQGRTNEDVFGEIVYAVTTLSSQRVGALIVLERSQRLKTYIEAGVALDAIVSYDMLVNVFSPDTPLHDGAVIISEGRIAAAACFLPLTLQPSLSKSYGTRHRASIGISEETDAVAIVVSEETGQISVAVEGKITGGLWAEALNQLLRSLFALKPESSKVSHAARA
jgi:diadenylate cyclase